MDHKKYWNPSLSTYWESANLEEQHPGFPCFTVLLYKSVKQGEEGEEDRSRILDNVLYTFPKNVPDREMIAFVGGLVTFMTFSRLNLNKHLTSFSWSESTIAVDSIELEGGDFLLFALKIPKFFSPFSVKTALQKTIQTLKFCKSEMNKKMTMETALSLKYLFKENSSLIELVAFPQKASDPFLYAARPSSAFASKAATCLATQLFEFARQTSPTVIGSAIFTQTEFVLSEIKQPLLDLLPYFGAISSKREDFETGRFLTFPLWIDFSEFGWIKEESKLHETSLSVVSFGSLSYYVLLDSQSSEITAIHAKLLSLLSNGISDFAVECESVSKEKLEGPPAIVYWEDTGAFKTTSFENTPQKGEKTPVDYTPILQKMSLMHDEFLQMKHLKELSILQNQKYLTGIKLPKIETIMEIKPEAGKPFIADAYARLKELIPNLPQDLLNL